MDQDLPLEEETSPRGRVVAAYQSAFPDPLKLSAGESLTVEEKPCEWEGWLWCTTGEGKSGWVPAPYARREGNVATMLCDYDATELTVRVGEILSMGQVASDWVWCTNAEGQSGWVPLENIARL